MLWAGSAILASSRCGRGGRGLRAAGWFAAIAALVTFSGCFSLDQPQRRVQLETLLQEPELLVVVDPRAVLAFVTAGRALTFSTGVDAGKQLRAEFALPAPTLGFAEAFVAALREQPRLASTRLRIVAWDEAAALVREQGAPQVFYLHTGEWRLYYDLSLKRYTMKVWLNAQLEPAAQVAADRGTLSLPERLWKGSCTFRGPTSAQPIEAWRANGGALLHEVLAEAQQRCGRKAAELFGEFLEGGDAQGAFDFGDLPKQQRSE